MSTADRPPDAATYPRRPKFWAHKFVRLLTKACAAQDIGPEACWLLSVVAHQEDVKRYSGPVTYWNEQLMPLCGFGGRARLVHARAKAVQAGWLHYREGGKGRPGEYWTVVPDRYSDLVDTAVDESICRSESEQQTERQTDDADICRSESERKPERQPDGNRNGKPATFIPSPAPNPNPKESARSEGLFPSEDPPEEAATPAPKPKPKRARKPASEPDGFADWYTAYPRHVARAAAAKAYPEAIADLGTDHADPVAVLMDATRAYAAAVAQWPQTEHQFIPHGATWLRAARYRDDRATWSRQNGNHRNRRQLDNRGQRHPDEDLTRW